MYYTLHHGVRYSGPTVIVSTAIAEAVAEWQKLKEDGKLEGGVEEEEEDIYAEARMVDVSVCEVFLILPSQLPFLSRVLSLFL